MSERMAKDMLKSFVERVERLEEEKKSLADDIRDVMAEAKANGFDTKALRAIIRLRKLDVDERKEQEAILETYMGALGMLLDLDVPPGGIEAALDRRRSERGKAHAERTQACIAHVDVLRSPQFNFGAAVLKAPICNDGAGPLETLACRGAETSSGDRPQPGGQHGEEAKDRVITRNHSEDSTQCREKVTPSAASDRQERSESDRHGSAASSKNCGSVATAGANGAGAITPSPFDIAIKALLDHPPINPKARARFEAARGAPLTVGDDPLLQKLRSSTSPAHARDNGTPLADASDPDRAQIAGDRPRPGDGWPRGPGGVEQSGDDDAHGIPAFLRRVLQ
jgi:uncharacterized protein (UPF0335 family)